MNIYSKPNSYSPLIRVDKEHLILDFSQPHTPRNAAPKEMLVDGSGWYKDRQSSTLWEGFSCDAEGWASPNYRVRTWLEGPIKSTGCYWDHCYEVAFFSHLATRSYILNTASAQHTCNHATMQTGQEDGTDCVKKVSPLKDTLHFTNVDKHWRSVFKWDRMYSPRYHILLRRKRRTNQNWRPFYKVERSWKAEKDWPWKRRRSHAN